MKRQLITLTALIAVLITGAAAQEYEYTSDREMDTFGDYVEWHHPDDWRQGDGLDTVSQFEYDSNSSEYRINVTVETGELKDDYGTDANFSAQILVSRGDRYLRDAETFIYYAWGYPDPINLEPGTEVNGPGDKTYLEWDASNEQHVFHVSQSASELKGSVVGYGWEDGYRNIYLDINSTEWDGAEIDSTKLLMCRDSCDTSTDSTGTGSFGMSTSDILGFVLIVALIGIATKKN